MKNNYNNKKTELVWNTYIDDINSNEIKEYNIFNHGGFYETLCKIKKEYKRFEKELKCRLIKETNDKQSTDMIETTEWVDKLIKELEKYKNSVFIESVDTALGYYFKYRSEYEIVLTSFPPYIDNKEFGRLKEEAFKYKQFVNLSTERKVDIYNQVKINFNIFIDYLWENIDLIKVSKINK